MTPVFLEELWQLIDILYELNPHVKKKLSAGPGLALFVVERRNPGTAWPCLELSSLLPSARKTDARRTLYDRPTPTFSIGQSDHHPMSLPSRTSSVSSSDGRPDLSAIGKILGAGDDSQVPKLGKTRCCQFLPSFTSRLSPLPPLRNRHSLGLSSRRIAPLPSSYAYDASRSHDGCLSSSHVLSSFLHSLSFVRPGLEGNLHS